MKCVMLSIRPKYCELIASGKKTVEVRRTKPKIDVPFKCYIYCTKGEPLMKTAGNDCFIDKQYRQGENLYGLYEFLNGKVIGEFVCDRVVQFENDCYTPAFDETADLSCLEYKELYDYLGAKEYGYGWLITDLVIYDKPKELSEFRRYVKDRCTFNEDGVCLGRNQNHVIMCEHLDCCQKEIKRPFQSWGYVEELKGEK